MHDSGYYLELMNHYDSLIKKTEKEKDKYEKLKLNLKSLNIGLPNIQSSLQSAKNDFLNGGYIDGDETFDKGILDNHDTDLNGINQSISTLMSKSGTKILELEEKIKEYKRLYEQASIDYRNACQTEKGD